MNVKDYFKLNLEKNLWVHICLYSVGEIELRPIDRSYFLVPIFLRKEGGYPDYIFVSIPYIGLVFTSHENKWRHFTDNKNCQIIESILKYKNGFKNNILHLNKITECLKITTFKIVFTLDVFFSAETTMHCKVTCILYKKQAHFSCTQFHEKLYFLKICLSNN
jgi:hypothetical protein